MGRRALVLAVLAVAACAPGSAGARTSCGAQIRRAVWHHEPAGLRLVVTPTTCGRATADKTPKAAFDEAIRLGGRPHPRNRGSLYWQFVCHAEFAPDKPTWDLETWRPDVGLTATILAACNPA